MLQIRLGDSVDFFNQVKRPNDFGFHLRALLNEELFEIILVRYDSSEFLFFVHQTKVVKVALK